MKNVRSTFEPAERICSVSEYYFSKKLKEVAKMNHNGKDVINLGVGSPDLPPTKEVIDELCQEAHQQNAHGYQPYVGIPELRSNFAQWYKRWYEVELNPNSEIQPLMGSKEGILHITLAFVNPGEKVLVPNPGYPTYSSLSKLLGAKVVNYDLKEENQWMPNFDELEQMDLSDVKLMWTNYPNMPTGANATKELFEKLIAFGKKHNIIIVNDNPYSFILNKKPMSILSLPGAKECCIELNSMSKSHNMPGWRIAMLASNSQFVEWVLKVKSNIDSGMFKGLQTAAAKALMVDSSFYKLNNIKYKKRKTVALRIMDLLNCKYQKDQVGMFVWAKIPNHYQDVEELTEEILHKANVFVTPGFIFGSNGKRYIRISLCCRTKRLEEAYERIATLITKEKELKYKTRIA